MTLWNNTKNIGNNDSNDTVICASLWFEFFGGLPNVKIRDIWEGNVTTRREI